MRRAHAVFLAVLLGSLAARTGRAAEGTTEINLDDDFTDGLDSGKWKMPEGLGATSGSGLILDADRAYGFIEAVIPDDAKPDITLAVQNEFTDGWATRSVSLRVRRDSGGVIFARVLAWKDTRDAENVNVRPTVGIVGGNANTQTTTAGQTSGTLILTLVGATATATFDGVASAEIADAPTGDCVTLIRLEMQGDPELVKHGVVNLTATSSG